MEATHPREIGPSALTPLRTRSRSRLACTGAALLLWSCAQGSSGAAPGEAPLPTPLARSAEEGGAQPVCAGNNADETSPDLPPPALQRSGAVSPCNAQDPGVDWSAVPLLAASTPYNLRMRVRHGSTLDVCIEGSGLRAVNYELFIDTDGNAATGVQETPWRSLGAEYKVVNNALHGPSAAYAWPAPSGSAPTVAQRSDDAIVVHISPNLLPGLTPYFGLAFRTLNGWGPARCGWLPGAANHPARLAQRGVPGERRAQRGLIIPVYALVEGANPVSPNPTLTQEQCTAVLAGDYSSLKLIEARRGDIDTSNGATEGPFGVLADVGDDDLDDDIDDGDDDPDDDDPDDDGDSGEDGSGGPSAEPGFGGGPSAEPGFGGGSSDATSKPDVGSVGQPPAGPAKQSTDRPNVWDRLAKGASNFGAKQAGRDYWVAVNGPSNRPFMYESDFQAAVPQWEKIRAQGGKIFGYVHTHVTKTGPQLRPLCEVVADVARWTLGFPEIDGIWIDEFYPQHEDNTTTGGGAQVDPRSGYSAKLTRAIHDIDAKLLLIGNAGAPFESNRRRYGELVDVACTFENKLSSAAPHNWEGLTKAPIIPTYGQLALIHGFDPGQPCAPDSACPEATLKATVQRAFDHGYSHIFITDAVYVDEEKASALKPPLTGPQKPALWLDLPEFFDALVAEVAGQVTQRSRSK